MHASQIHQDKATGKVVSVTIRRPSNFHAHFRRDAMMRAVTKSLIRVVRYALVMPNTGPVTTIEEMAAYHAELRAIADEVADHQVDFVMTLYLTNKITPTSLNAWQSSAFLVA